nr:protein phosphatase [Shimia biformata]
MRFDIFSLSAGTGELALAPLPGRFGDYSGDLARVIGWAPGLVLSMTEWAEMQGAGAGDLGRDLGNAGIDWVHLPVRDFDVPTGKTLDVWPDASRRAQAVLQQGGRVLIHCYGGCGRSGMAAARILVEMGEDPAPALARLRQVRPCAIETEDQKLWAIRP